MGGALTKAVDWVRNAVFAVLMAETSEATAPPDANGRKGVTPCGPATANAPVPLHPAKAAEDADSMTTKPALAKVQPPQRIRDDAKIVVIPVPNKSGIIKNGTAKNLEQRRGPPKAFAPG